MSYETGEVDTGLSEMPFALEGETTAPLAESETVMEPITLVDFQQAVSDICHINLFCSFLICGVLIALAIFRSPNGT